MRVLSCSKAFCSGFFNDITSCSFIYLCAQLCGAKWYGLESIVEGQCSPYACNDLWLLASILRMELMTPVDRQPKR